MVHLDDDAYCFLCKIRFITSEQIKKHFKEKHSNYQSDAYRCYACVSCQYVNLRNLIRHFVNKHCQPDRQIENVLDSNLNQDMIGDRMHQSNIDQGNERIEIDQSDIPQDVIDDQNSLIPSIMDNCEQKCDNISESVCDKPVVVEPGETNPDNLPSLAQIFEIGGEKILFEKIVETKYVSSVERQKLVNCVGIFLANHYKSLTIPIQTLKYYAKELSKISQDTEEDYFCYWISSRIRSGKLVEHRKPVGRLYKFFEYRRRKYKLDEQKKKN
uniref:Uncharacterized protein LOC113796427 n=1 Tax=Dermatophagoides pteronyssinus TaxID=6956 RepID=A0A6P6YC25_DERPT|nr:uncharacterized protein LOC113796427 [Dermatophagoides pteronyssinus]